MTLLLSARGVTKSFGTKLVADHLDLFVSRGEKVALVGVNGCGKSTLLSMLAGAERPEEGEVISRRGIRVGYLSQDPPVDPARTAREEVAQGLVEINHTRARLLAVEAALSSSRDGDNVSALLEEQAELQHALEESQGWNPEHQVENVMRALGVTFPDRPLGTLSGGERKRAALGRVVLSRPDLLLLDEPTNHLDADTVLWLEEFLANFGGGCVFVTHDRYFLDNVATRTAELHKGTLTIYEGGFEEYLLGKQERMEREARAEDVRLNLVRTELEWLRRGPKARGTKQKARIDRAKTLIENKPDREQKLLDIGSSFTTPRLGKTILEVQGLRVAYGEKQVLDAISFALRSGDRVGVIGPNGAGKSTFLKALIGTIPTAPGVVTLGKNTEISYFAQQRAALPEDETLWEVVGNGADYVDVGGRRYHLAGYLGRFLFEPGAHRQKIKSLSGGEKARVELAILLQRPSNVLVLDEPTNDLDLQTLQALEAALLEFAGSCIVVTHDRYFLDKVATAIYVLEPGPQGAKATRYEGNYQTYRSLRAQAEREQQEREKAAKTAQAAQSSPAQAAKPAAKPVKKRSLPEEKEFSELPQKIEQAEAIKAALDERLADPELYKGPPDELRKVREGAEKTSRLIEALYARWEELEALGG